MGVEERVFGGGGEGEPVEGSEVVRGVKREDSIGFKAFFRE